MEIRIPLNVSSSANTYAELRANLKQLELSVHHAQKAVESAEKEGVGISEDSHICFGYPVLQSSLEIDTHKEPNETLTTFMDNYYEELQSLELVINIQ